MSCPGAAGRDGRASRSDGAPAASRFPRASRLTARRQFTAVHENGKGVRSASFTLLGLPNTAGRSRIGITVSRKLGGAVVRNRIKRKVREVFRYNQAALVPPLDLVLIARNGIEERTVIELQKEFLRRFEDLIRRLAG